MTNNMDQFDGMFPEHADWWRAHLAEPATVVLRCGQDGCRDQVGEIKRDEAVVLVLTHNKFPEATIPAAPAAALNEEELQRRIAARDAQTLRYTDDGRRVAKRHRANPVVQPLAALSFYVCPTHGVVQLADQPAAVEELRQFVDATEPRSRRVYLLTR